MNSIHRGLLLFLFVLRLKVVHIILLFKYEKRHEQEGGGWIVLKLGPKRKQTPSDMALPAMLTLLLYLVAGSLASARSVTDASREVFLR